MRYIGVKTMIHRSGDVTQAMFRDYSLEDKDHGLADLRYSHFVGVDFQNEVFRLKRYNMPGKL